MNSEPLQPDRPVDEVCAELRCRMVEQQLLRRDITDERVLQAMRTVPRHEFIPDTPLERAHADHPISIGQGQTISQPYIVALTTQLIRPEPHFRVLDVGTGSGYQAAVLGELVAEVLSLEIVPELAKSARSRLVELGYSHVQVRNADAWRGWPEAAAAPFDAIVAAAAPETVPPRLIEQLRPGGRLVMPVGRERQTLVVVEKLTDGTTRTRDVCPVSFVPMTGGRDRRNP
jgi:protein-L-isoaspartate(D-aspartate) O-methyltransferase